MTMATAFRPGDGPGLVRAWCRSLTADPITPARFRDLVLLDPNFDPAGLRVARTPDGDVLGAAYAVRRKHAFTGADLEQECGWLVFFFVDPAAQGVGIGRSLVQGCLDWLRAQGRTHVEFSPYTPNYILPGLDRHAYPAAGRLLDGLGFSVRYQAVAMQRSLVDYTPPESVTRQEAAMAEQGWRIGSPEADELPDLVTLAGEHFNPDWARAIREAVVGGLDLDRIVIARRPGGELAGWAMHGAYSGALDRFGPFGVRDDLRGLGLGKVLLNTSMQSMRAAGAQVAWFLWTGERSPAGHLYLNNGFQITRRFDIMRKEL
ncbi:MAG: GNAT family N-acetyltransferase [Dehalococcoidia bacterium]